MARGSLALLLLSTGLWYSCHHAVHAATLVSTAGQLLAAVQASGGGSSVELDLTADIDLGTFLSSDMQLSGAVTLNGVASGLGQPLPRLTAPITGALLRAAPSTTLRLTNLTLANFVPEFNLTTPTLTLGAFTGLGENGARLELAEVNITQFGCNSTATTAVLPVRDALCGGAAWNTWSGVQVWPDAVFVEMLESPSLQLTRVWFSCSGVPPGSPASSACAGAIVNSHAELAAQLDILQAAHDNVTMCIASGTTMVLGRTSGGNLTMTKRVRIRSTRPVPGAAVDTAPAIPGLAWLDMAGGGTDIIVPPTGALELTWIGLTNLPLGPDQLFLGSSFVGYLWNFNFPRVVGDIYVQLVNVAMILPDDLNSFLTAWWTRLFSPIPSTVASAQWLVAIPGLQNATLQRFEASVAEPGSLERFNNKLRYAPGQLWVNVSIAPAHSYNRTLLPSVGHTGVLDVGPGNVDGLLSPSQLNASCTAAEVRAALPLAGAGMPYVINTCHMRWWLGAGAAGGAGDPPPPAMLAPGAAVSWQGHPLRSGLSVDFGGEACAVTLGHGSSLTIRNLTLYNPGVVVAQGVGSADTPFVPSLQAFTTGLWAVCNASSDTALVLHNVTLVVPPEELAVLMSALTGRGCGCAASEAELSAVAKWALMSQVTVVNATTLYVTTWRGWRWSGTAITVTCDPAVGAFTSQPLADGVTFGEPAPGSGSSGVPLVAWVVPVAVCVPLLILGVVLLLWLRRRRGRQGVHGDAYAPKASDDRMDGPSMRCSSGGAPPPDTHSTSDCSSTGGSDTVGGCGNDRSAVTGTPGTGEGRSPKQQYAAAALAGIAAGPVSPARSGRSQHRSRSNTLRDDSGLLDSGPLEKTVENGSNCRSNQRGSPADSPDATDRYGAGSRLGGPPFRSDLQALVSELASATGGARQPLATILLTRGSERSGGSSRSAGGTNMSWDDSTVALSDSFERPGSEYGDMALVSQGDVQGMLQDIRCEMAATSSKLVIYDVLGAGAYGVVYKGEWRGRPVAVKTLLFQDRLLHGRQAALREVAVNSKFCHPNIVNTLTFELKPISQAPDVPSAPGSLSIEQGVTAGDYKLYIVQEFCDAGHLKKAVDNGLLLGSDGTPDLLSVIQVALDLACGLQHVHFKNVIHGDLSPANVLLKTDANRPGRLKLVAKVGDFGCCKVLADAEQTHVSGVRGGTPHYTAPEIMLHGQLTRAADVFSFGVILHELYCGQPVWRRKFRPAVPRPRRVKHDSTSPLATGASDGLGRSASARPWTLERNSEGGAGGVRGDTGPGDVGVNSPGGPPSHKPSSSLLQQPPHEPGPAGECGSTPAASGGMGSSSTSGRDPVAPLAQRSQTTNLGNAREGLGFEPGLSTAGGEAGRGGSAPPGLAVTIDVLGLAEQQAAQATLTGLQRFMSSPDGAYPLPPLPPSCPAWYQELVWSCVQGDPADRPRLPAIVALLMAQLQVLQEQGAGSRGNSGILPMTPL